MSDGPSSAATVCDCEPARDGLDKTERTRMCTAHAETKAERAEADPPRRPNLIGLQAWRLEVRDSKSLFGKEGTAVFEAGLPWWRDATVETAEEQCWA